MTALTAITLLQALANFLSCAFGTVNVAPFKRAKALGSSLMETLLLPVGVVSRGAFVE